MSTSRPRRRASASPRAAVFDRVAGLAEHRHVDLAAQRAQLLDGGRTLQVGAHEQWLPALALEPASQLGAIGRLAGTLKSGHQHHGGWATGIRDLEGLATEHGGELGVDDLDDLLAGIERLAERDADGLLADAGDDVADDADVDVGLEQRGADLASGPRRRRPRSAGPCRGSS